MSDKNDYVNLALKTVGGKIKRVRGGYQQFGLVINMAVVLGRRNFLHSGEKGVRAFMLRLMKCKKYPSYHRGML
tara:strand:+ start:182 stop:403 length:222 start_codon:yes stop_codon:yes gene_type:complete